ncbi:MAG TPA: HAD family phosphatase [Terracidiphilus sp.]|nr:HAD family phosphatase [Terracidiphilus sp.]
MALRAVIFDYGMVLTGQPDKEAHDAMVRLTGLSTERFESFYWADRLAYDAGTLNSTTFWQSFLRDAGLEVSADKVEELHRLDACMWTTTDPDMLAWQLQLKQHGIRTAILSNMGDGIHQSMERKFDWLPRFDVLVWSYQLGMIKPKPEIYLHTLERLGTRPDETLFLDDRLENVEAARALGLVALQFSTVPQLRADLIAAGLDSQLPVPA